MQGTGGKTFGEVVSSLAWLPPCEASQQGPTANVAPSLSFAVQAPPCHLPEPGPGRVPGAHRSRQAADQPLADGGQPALERSKREALQLGVCVSGYRRVGSKLGGRGNWGLLGYFFLLLPCSPPQRPPQGTRVSVFSGLFLK